VRERLADAEAAAPDGDEKLSVEELQRRARESWLALKAQQPENALSIEELQQKARERWREYQQSKGAEGEQSQKAEREGQFPEHEKDSDRGIDDDLGL
jgi:hypothetical protein